MGSSSMDCLTKNQTFSITVDPVDTYAKGPSWRLIIANVPFCDKNARFYTRKFGCEICILGWGWRKLLSDFGILILSLSNDCYLFFALGNSLLESRYLISKCKMVMKVAMTGLFAFWDKRFDGIGVGIKLISLSQRISCIEMDIFVYLIYVSLVCRFHYHLQSFRNSFESHYSHVEGRGCTSAW